MGTIRARAAATVRRLGTERVVLVAYLAFTVWVLVDPSRETQRVWATVAAIGYAAALVGLSVGLGPRRSCLVAAVGSVVVPTVLLVVRGMGQPEIRVVHSGAVQLMSAGSPYLPDPSSVYEYRPYLPALYAFGVVPATGGDLRLPALALLVAALVAVRFWSRRVPAGPVDHRAALDTRLALLVACPLVAAAIAVSGVDVPQAALTVLAIALVARHRYAWSAVAIGLTMAIKPTGACAAFVLVVCIYRRDGLAAALRFAGVSGATALVTVLPVARTDPRAMWANVVEFPSGESLVQSPAASPLPGVLLRLAGVPAWASLALVLVAGAAFAVWCVVRSSPDVSWAASRIALGLCLAFLLVPYSRVGYFLVPVLVFFPFQWAALHGRTPAYA
ncbi:glycosyltransferase family 87 protein [Nocardioides sp.]|uniref:glycosyltransferase family 87 protein n=1 Tax=Nocardioides sp. TaxID=35761 RepID=UPI0037850AA9